MRMIFAPGLLLILGAQAATAGGSCGHKVRGADCPPPASIGRSTQDTIADTGSAAREINPYTGLPRNVNPYNQPSTRLYGLEGGPYGRAPGQRRLY